MSGLMQGDEADAPRKRPPPTPCPECDGTTWQHRLGCPCEPDEDEE